MITFNRSNNPYADLLKLVLTRALFSNTPERHTIARAFGLELARVKPFDPYNYVESGHEAKNRHEDAETMLGLKQLDNMQQCIETVQREKIPGDFVECGVWRGGMAIFMRALADWHRRVFVADSFAGLPPQSRRDVSWKWRVGQFAVSKEEVEDNFRRFGLMDNQVVFIRGFFQHTLPGPIRLLSILRLDADLYSSTLCALQRLYPLLTPGGFAIMDDYSNMPDCRAAIDEYRAANDIHEPIVKIDKRAIYWRKK